MVIIFEYFFLNQYVFMKILEKGAAYKINYFFDTNYENIKIGGDYDFFRSTEKSTHNVRFGVEFLHENEKFSKVMVNNKKEFFVTVGKNFFNFGLFTFGGKVIKNF